MVFICWSQAVTTAVSCLSAPRPTSGPKRRVRHEFRVLPQAVRIWGPVDFGGSREARHRHRFETVAGDAELLRFDKGRARACIPRPTNDSAVRSIWLSCPCLYTTTGPRFKKRGLPPRLGRLHRGGRRALSKRRRLYRVGPFASERASYRNRGIRTLVDSAAGHRSITTTTYTACRRLGPPRQTRERIAVHRRHHTSTNELSRRLAGRSRRRMLRLGRLRFGRRARRAIADRRVGRRLRCPGRRGTTRPRPV